MRLASRSTRPERPRRWQSARVELGASCEVDRRPRWSFAPSSASAEVDHGRAAGAAPCGSDTTHWAATTLTLAVRSARLRAWLDRQGSSPAADVGWREQAGCHGQPELVAFAGGGSAEVASSRQGWSPAEPATLERGVPERFTSASPRREQHLHGPGIGGERERLDSARKRQARRDQRARVDDAAFE